jgi:O-antigen ligase
LNVLWQHAFNHKHFIVIFVVLLSGVFVSAESTKVLTNVIHLAFGAFSALLFAIGLLGKPNALRKTCLVVLLPVFFVLVASLLLLLVRFHIEEVFDFLVEGRRYAGIAGNPNTLGGLCVIGIWSTLSLVYLSNSKFSVLPFTLFSLFGFGLVLSGSATSAITSLIVVAMLLWGIVLKWCSGITIVVLNSLVVLISLFLALFLVMSVGDNYLELATETVGRETTFSGRIELWAVAREAIGEKPLFGWAYDSHLSVFGYQQYFVPFNHYHNGYLDTLVAGGFVLGGLVLVHFIQFFLTYFRVSKNNKKTLPLLLPVMIVLSTNFAEYSLLRNNSPIWTAYMVSYFVLVTLAAGRNEGASNSRISRRRGVKRSKKKRIAT